MHGKTMSHIFWVFSIFWIKELTMYKKRKSWFLVSPGSGKTTLSKKLSEWLPAVHLNADEVRAQADDWDCNGSNPSSIQDDPFGSESKF